ncbi:ABC transporter permease, partial [Bacillus subtilis]|nr:ABC transporter permease [Bacillus subtilis]
LKRPHAEANPGVRDSEAAWLAAGIRAIGYVSAPRRAALLDARASGWRASIDRVRDALRTRIGEVLGTDAAHRGIVAALAIGIAVGLGFGFLNGVFVAFAGMPPIIVTLATMGIARGLALIYTGGYPIDGLPDWVAFFGSGKVLGIQAPVLIMLVVYAIAWLLLDRMPFGRYVYAIGGNEQATRLTGVR